MVVTSVKLTVSGNADCPLNLQVVLKAEDKVHSLTVRDVQLNEAGQVKLTAKDFQTEANLIVKGKTTTSGVSMRCSRGCDITAGRGQRRQHIVLNQLSSHSLNCSALGCSLIISFVLDTGELCHDRKQFTECLGAAKGLCVFMCI